MDQDHYRRKAMDCLAAAERSSELADRYELLRIAQSFIRLAAYAANRHDPDPPGSGLDIKAA